MEIEDSSRLSTTIEGITGDVLGELAQIEQKRETLTKNVLILTDTSKGLNDKIIEKNRELFKLKGDLRDAILENGTDTGKYKKMISEKNEEIRKIVSEKIKISGEVDEIKGKFNNEIKNSLLELKKFETLMRNAVSNIKRDIHDLNATIVDTNMTLSRVLDPASDYLDEDLGITLESATADDVTTYVNTSPITTVKPIASSEIRLGISDEELVMSEEESSSEEDESSEEESSIEEESSSEEESSNEEVESMYPIDEKDNQPGEKDNQPNNDSEELVMSEEESSSDEEADLED
jgi:hypothetical protein